MTEETKATSTPDAGEGLTSQQVADRHSQGQSNHVDSSSSRPVSAILRANLFTVFNAILFTAALAVILVGDWRDAVFGIVLVLNLAIGVLGELRSKRALDSLAVLQAPTSQVLRDGHVQTVNNEDLVVDDVVELALGDQVPADGSMLSSRGLEVNESALTGESHPVTKTAGDQIMSGTSVIAGTGTMLVQKIGADAWAQKITSEAKQYSKAYSEIQGSIDKVLRWITMVLPVIVILLMWSQLRVDGGNWKAAIILTVAGVVGMIPQGLVLLTSMNFGMAAATLARRGVLVQELPAVEILARVDVLCLDKTGTLTTGEIRGHDLVGASGTEPQDGDGPTKQVLATMVQSDDNATAQAVQELLPGVKPLAEGEFAEIPFNSIRKWSALTLEGPRQGQKPTWVFGAPEVVLNLTDPNVAWVEDVVSKASSQGRRTVCLASTDAPVQGEALPSGLQPQLVAILEEDVRPDAKQTLQYFEDQGVTVKIISGDSQRTVGAIAADLGLAAAGTELTIKDARTLPPIDDPDFGKEAAGVDVFGRVTPDQKKALVVALQDQGHTVAMTGDGVNDALALKTADLGIAMGNGAPATKAVSRLVLVNSQFSVLPGVVAEGRRIIANMERVSALFLSKTTYAILLAVVVAIFGLAYPFLPRHLTYISTFTIGVPAFFLSISPNKQRYKPGFLKRTLLIAVPSGLALGAAALTAYLMVSEQTDDSQTAATLSVIIGAMALLIVLARPWKAWKIGLVLAMIAGATLGLVIPPIRQFFALAFPTTGMWLVIAVVGGVAAALIAGSYKATEKLRQEAGERK